MYVCHILTKVRNSRDIKLLELKLTRIGGQLKISHQGHDRIFDWGNDEPTSIKWAAFYSDCEHEVLEVQSGHRVTLTYNLYVSEQVGGIFQLYPTAE